MASESKSCAKRDRLLEIEAWARKRFEDEDVYRAESRENPPKQGEKFFSTFPFPYMNGDLHVGHAYSLSKIDFASGYHRLRGANVLLPFGFHCTGMPIKASADKLSREINQFGNPPVFDNKTKQDPDPTPALSPDKFKGKKSKVAAKASGQVHQWEIMRSFGLSDSEIVKFQDPYEWLYYFPPLAVEDLKAYGLGCDWRRSFVTTDVNPFFDSFVKWQMRKLKSMGKIVKDLRYTIFSPFDNQPCADHDRATGEGVQPQAYTLIKMEVLQPFPLKLGALEGKNKRVFFVTASLTPEVLPDGNYGAYEINETDVFIVTERYALNLAYQGFSKIPQKTCCLVELTGEDLIGLPLRSPLSVNEIMLVGEFDGKKVEEIEPIIKEKLIKSGEAILYFEPKTQVISRSGDECVVALTEQWFITYGEEEWRKMAEECLSKMNLYSKETKHGFEKALTWLKQWACSRSFGLGTRIPWDEEFLVESLSDSSLYMAYYTVAHFFHDGDMYKGSKSLILPHQMNDEVWEYLFCDGPYPNPNPKSSSEDIPSSAVLAKMKQEFDYWYPLDLRVSGKDLIQNHLTFFIYNHTALMAERNWPRGIRCNGHILLNTAKMSKSSGNFRTLRQAIQEFSATATRFVLADASDGFDDANFDFKNVDAAILRLTKELTWMEEVVVAADGRRGPATSYGDKVFENEMNIAIRLTEKAYKDCKFREALKNGFRYLQDVRDEYRVYCGGDGMMNHDLILRFIDVETRVIAPICPQFAEYVWNKVLKNQGCVITAGWPESKEPDSVLKLSNKYLKDLIEDMRKRLKKQLSGSKKAAQATSKEKKLIKGLVYVNEQFDGWRANCLTILQRKFNEETCRFAPDEEIRAEVREMMEKDGNFKKIQEQCMRFVKFMKDEAISLGPQALNLSLPFGEIEFLKSNKDLIQRKLGLEEVEIYSASNPAHVEEAGPQASVLIQNPPSPGTPTAIFLTK